MTDPMELATAARQAVLDGDEEAARRVAAAALETGMPPLDLVEQGLVPGVQEAGRLWEEGEFFLPELIGGAQAMKAAMDILQPALLGGQGRNETGRVVIGTIQGDIHDIGKTLVATLLAANGFQVSDEGCDVPIERFVERAREIDADLVCASALLTTTMTRQKDLIDAIRADGLRAQVMVGGAPVTREWATEIQADGFAENAMGAVREAKKLVGARDA